MNRQIYDIPTPEPMPPRPARSRWVAVAFIVSAALLVLALLHAQAGRPKGRGGRPVQDTRSYRMPFRST